MPKNKSPMLEILRCKHCPELAVSINDTRITSHKCAGQWTIIARLPYNAEVAIQAIQESREAVSDA